MTANGQLAPGQLVFVQGPIQLAPQTADAFRRLAERAAAQGENLDIWTPAGGYRSLATQRDMIARPAAYNVRPGVTLASPGRSTHGQGRTVDLLGRRAWIRANAPAFGFKQRDAVGDPDCWTHGDYMNTEGAAPSGGSTAPLPTTEQDDDMSVGTIIWTGPATGPTVAYLCTGAGSTGIQNAAELLAARRVIRAGQTQARDIPDHLLPAEFVAWGTLTARINAQSNPGIATLAQITAALAADDDFSAADEARILAAISAKIDTVEEPAPHEFTPEELADLGEAIGERIVIPPALDAAEVAAAVVRALPPGVTEASLLDALRARLAQ